MIITRRVWEFRQQISKAKYPKISQKYWSKISGRFRRTPLHCTERKTLQVSIIRRSGYVYLEKSKSPPLPSSYRISGCKMSAYGMSSFPIWRQNSGCKHPGWKVRGSRVQILPERNVVRMPSDGISGRPVRVYSLYGFQRTLLNLWFALVIKKLLKHQNLTQFD